MTVLVGYTDTPEARSALAEAVAYAKAHGQPLHIAHILVHEAGDSPTQVRREMNRSEAAEQTLERMRDELTSEKLVVTEEVRHALRGGASDALLAIAKEQDASLIVVGVERRTPVGKLVLGSVAQDVILRADCPVLAVKTKPA